MAALPTAMPRKSHNNSNTREISNVRPTNLGGSSWLRSLRLPRASREQFLVVDAEQTKNVSKILLGLLCSGQLLVLGTGSRTRRRWAAELTSGLWGHCCGCRAMPAIPCSAPLEAGGMDIDEVAGIGAPVSGCGCFLYHRLPEPLLRLSIRKLDGSRFDVQIARTAAVWELKAAVEDVFTLPYDDTGETISWQHVWGHFCLCFMRHKLTDDKATLPAFGIKDGDELHFVQHLSIDYSPCKRLSKNHKMALHRRSMTALDELVEDENDDNKPSKSRSSSSLIDNRKDKDFYVYDYKEEQQIQLERYKKGHFFLGFFSYSRLRNSRTHSEEFALCSKNEKRGPWSKFEKWFGKK